MEQVDFSFIDRALESFPRIGRIVDREVGCQSHIVGILADQARPEPMKSTHPNRLSRSHFHDPVTHFARCLVGKRQCQDLGCGDSRAEQVSYPVGHHSSLAATWACQGEKWALLVSNGFALGLVKRL